VRLRGPLKLEALLNALEGLEERHEVLRTRYPAVDGVGSQEILPLGVLRTDVVDLSSRAPIDSAEVRQLIQNEADHSFALDRECPIRCRILRLGETEHVLVLVLHHIVTDGPSVALLFADLAELYAAKLDGRPAALQPLPVQFADFAVHQRWRVEKGDLEAELAYWTLQLRGAPESLDLPTDRPRPAVPSFGGGLVEFRWSRDLTARVLDVARRRGMTPFMVLLAAYQLLLARWSGQTDLCVGTPVAAHADPRTAGLIGNFLNTLVMRARATPTLTSDAFLDQVRRTAIASYEHSEVPFDVVVAALRTGRQDSVNPLFQTLFALDEVAGAPLRLPGLETERLWPELRSAKFDLSLFMALEEDRLRGGFEFATDLFDRETIARLASHFEVLVEALLDRGDTRIGNLPLLSAEAHRQLVEDWNATVRPLPKERTLHGLFRQRLASHPDRTALICGPRRMSYAELDEATDRIAARLVAIGVGPEQVVGICMDRRPELVVGLLGILKSGAAYVPLDPAYPAARLAFMLADCRVRALVTLESLRPLLPEHQADLICLDQWPTDAVLGTPSSRADAGPDNLAYIIYTSGSTGRPKGVALTHANATAFLAWAETAFPAEMTRTTIAATSICFDLSIFELFLPLTTGGTVVLVDSAAALIDRPLPATPTLLNTVPSAARALVEAGALPDGLAAINLAGEPLPRALVEALYAAAPSVRVFNLYGPSEYTTYATWCHVPSDRAALVGIGRPIGNTRIYILDRRGAPTPIGTPGEIFIAGAGLARGYAHRPGLTAERFVPDPFGPPGGRMYATGDLGRFRIDGGIHYLGRGDQQVKIRGFRIEPGEIEARLLRCAGVAESAVVPRVDRFGEPQLVAYIVPTVEGPRCTAEGLRAELARDLPAHMLPAAFELRDLLPLTPNGKVDRKAMVAAPPSNNIERSQYVAPRDATESLLAEVWGHVLRLDRVGIEDNFFALGGHSLLASAMIARLRQGPLSHIALRDIFVAPTVRELAARLKGATGGAHDILVPVDRNGPLPTSFSQQRMWFIDQLEPQSSLYNVCIAWRLTGALHVDSLHRSLAEIQARHEVLRVVFRATEDGEPVQIVTDPTPLPLPVIDLSACDNPEHAAELWLKDDSGRPFDLARGPLFRAGLLRLAPKEHILQLGMPHIVADGWSLDVILSELGVLYPAFLADEPSPLPPLPIQYADYAAWERRTMRGSGLDDHVRYCRDLLEGAPKQLCLPWDRPRPAFASYRGDLVEFVLDATLSEALRQLARRFQVTLFMLMAAIFDVLLYRHSGQEDLCIGYSVGNRTRLETEGLIGPFVNALVLRTRLHGGQSFAEHLAQVRERMLDADAHQEFPIEKLVEELNPPRDLAHHPIFQVTYSYSTTHSPRTRRTRTLRGVGERDVSLPGLDLGLVEPGYQSAKFDLSLFVSDTGDVLEGDVEYTTDLFEPETIRRIARQLDKLCRAVVDDPRRPLGALELLPEDERRQLLVEWNRTELPLDDAPSLHARFERQAALTPLAVAIEAGGELLSYAELNARANRLAHRLRRLGVAPDTRVAVCVGRRVELVVSLLAVLKAGGAYVPLDPAYPAAALAHMLRAAEAPVMLTDGTGAAALPNHAGITLVVASGADGFADEPATNPAPCVTPGNLAYCLFTSGSTGHPKAVALQHSNALALLAWAEKVYDLAETARTLAVTSASFDLSVFEIFLPLVRGGCVILVEDVAGCATAVAPSLLNIVPSSIQALLVERGLPATVRTINLAGEVLDRELVAEIEAAVPYARIVNLYGPTEYTTYATLDEVGGDRAVTVGRPVGNTRIYILDERLSPTPIGVPGELHIAGAGLARGYLGAPAITAARFVPDPFGAPGTRMYATGDIARYLPDGRIEFRGRRDHQVKLNGFRIELGEVEQALRRCEGVADAAVLLSEVRSGAACLAAFVALIEGATASAGALLEAVARILPRHMVPSVLSVLDAIPRTPNGKIDRTALGREPIADVTRPVADLAGPTSATELLLTNIFRDLLQRDTFGVHESFFALGGHSLSAIRLVTRLAATAGVSLPLRAVFEHPTVAGLAAYFDSRPEVSGPVALPEAPIAVLDRRRAARAPTEPSAVEALV
jgi:amino acid adenylation domain-containing protein